MYGHKQAFLDSVLQEVIAVEQRKYKHFHNSIGVDISLPIPKDTEIHALWTEYDWMCSN